MTPASSKPCALNHDVVARSFWYPATDTRESNRRTFRHCPSCGALVGSKSAAPTRSAYLTPGDALAGLARQVVAIEYDKGWRPNDNRFPESLALLHSEISEALEAYRSWAFDVPDLPKPEGVPSELADVLIRLLSTWDQYLAPLGFDLYDEVLAKLHYNITREYRHGGKLL